MDEIQTLIQALEKEQADLKKLIHEAVQNGEYLIAHFHSEAIGYVNRKLQTLRNLDDKSFDKKWFIKSTIERYEMQLGLDYPQGINDYFENEIERLQQKLHDLNEREKVSASESFVLAGCLDSLISHKIKNVKIVLKKSSNFLLVISRHRSGIKVLIPDLKSLRKNFTIHGEKIQHFFALGFNTNKNESRLTLVLRNRDRKQMLKELKTILAKIVFDIFYFKEFEGDTFIEIS